MAHEMGVLPTAEAYPGLGLGTSLLYIIQGADGSPPAREEVLLHLQYPLTFSSVVGVVDL